MKGIQRGAGMSPSATLLLHKHMHTMRELQNGKKKKKKGAEVAAMSCFTQTGQEVCRFDWPRVFHKSESFAVISELLYDFIYLLVEHGCKVCPCTLCSLTSTRCVAATPESGCVGIVHKKGCAVCVRVC